MRARAALLALTLWCVAPVAPARAHVVSDREVAVLRLLPSGRVRTLLADAEPDAHGLVGANRGHWRAIEAQAPAALLLADACARADTAAAERLWRTLDAAFIAQGPAGDFAYAGPAREVAAERAATTAWTGETCRALVVVMNSALAERFRFRYSLLLLKLRRTVDALVTAGEPDSTDGVALLVRARAMLLADGIYHEEAFGKAGQRALQAALALQSSDGGFATGRESLAGQATALECLQPLALYFPAPSLDGAWRRAGQRLLALADAPGAARLTGARGRHVALALALYGAAAGDDSASREATLLAKQLSVSAARSRR